MKWETCKIGGGLEKVSFTGKKGVRIRNGMYLVMIPFIMLKVYNKRKFRYKN